MDLVDKYKKIASELAHHIANSKRVAQDPIQIVVIEDLAKGHFLLYHDGWRGTNRVYGSFLHIEVKKSGKVWLQRDGTDLEVAVLLMKKGIPKTDIVLGFRPPIVRPDTGFAVA